MKIKTLFVLPLFLLVAACPLDQQYVDADRDTYEVVRPEMDKHLDKEYPKDSSDKSVRADRARWDRLLDSWKFRIETAEKKD